MQLAHSCVSRHKKKKVYLIICVQQIDSYTNNYKYINNSVNQKKILISPLSFGDFMFPSDIFSVNVQPSVLGTLGVHNAWMSRRLMWWKKSSGKLNKKRLSGWIKSEKKRRSSGPALIR